MIDIHANYGHGFTYACGNGHIEVVKLLLSLTNDRYIYLHNNYERAFNYACSNGQIAAELLVGLAPI